MIMHFYKIFACICIFLYTTLSPLPAVELILNNESLKEMIPSALFIKGNDASMRGDYQTAIHAFRDLINLQPNDNYLKRKLSAELIHSGELKDAEKILETIQNSSDKSGNKDEASKLILGGVYDALEKPEMAQKLFKEIILTSPGPESACVLLVKSFSTQKKYSKDYTPLATCELKCKDDPAYAYFSANIEMSLGHEALAIKLYNKSLKLNPSYFPSALTLGELYEDKKDFKSAQKIYVNFLATNGNGNNFSVLSRMVDILLLTGEKNAAIPYAEKLSSIDKSDLNLKVRLGVLYSDSGMYREAVNIFEEVLSIIPDSEKVIYYLAALNQQTNHPVEAIKYYKRIPASSSLYREAKLQIEKSQGIQIKNPK